MVGILCCYTVNDVFVYKTNYYYCCCCLEFKKKKQERNGIKMMHVWHFNRSTHKFCIQSCTFSHFGYGEWKTFEWWIENIIDYRLKHVYEGYGMVWCVEHSFSFVLHVIQLRLLHTDSEWNERNWCITTLNLNETLNKLLTTSWSYVFSFHRFSICLLRFNVCV